MGCSRAHSAWRQRCDRDRRNETMSRLAGPCARRRVWMWLSQGTIRGARSVRGVQPFVANPGSRHRTAAIESTATGTFEGPSKAVE
jgi:hypothetical protein